MTPKDLTDPSYYVRLDPQPREVIWSWCDGHPIAGPLAHILGYLGRCGHKPDNEVLTDLRKAKVWLDFAIDKLEDRDAAQK